MSFDIGDRPVATFTLTDPLGAGGLSAAVTFRLLTPDGTVVTVSSPNADITNPLDNVWKWVLPVLTQSGVNHVRARTTSGLMAAEEMSFVVNGTSFPTP